MRSKWQTKKAREGKARAETAKRVKDNNTSSEQKLASEDNVSTQQLDHLLIKFTVSQGFGDNDQVAAD